MIVISSHITRHVLLWSKLEAWNSLYNLGDFRALKWITSDIWELIKEGEVIYTRGLAGNQSILKKALGVSHTEWRMLFMFLRKNPFLFTTSQITGAWVLAITVSFCCVCVRSRDWWWRVVIWLTLIGKQYKPLERKISVQLAAAQPQGKCWRFRSKDGLWWLRCYGSDAMRWALNDTLFPVCTPIYFLPD